MLNLIVFICSLLICPGIWAKTVKIAVMDTGYFVKHHTFNKCIEPAEIDFTKTGMEDDIGHGQNTTHIISDGLKGLNYCVVPIKVYTDKKNEEELSGAYILGLIYVLMQKDIDILNISLVGYEKSQLEKDLIEAIQKNGTIVVTAAGNSALNLDKKCNAYPACVNNQVISVGCLELDNKTKCNFTNYGKRVKVWKVGRFVTAGGITMSGTSQSSPKAVVDIAKKLMEKK